MPSLKEMAEEITKYLKGEREKTGVALPVLTHPTTQELSDLISIYKQLPDNKEFQVFTDIAKQSDISAMYTLDTLDTPAPDLTPYVDAAIDRQTAKKAAFMHQVANTRPRLVDLLRRLIIKSRHGQGMTICGNHPSGTFSNPIHTPFLSGDDDNSHEHSEFVHDFTTILNDQIKDIATRKIDAALRSRQTSELISGIMKVEEEYYETLLVTINSRDVRLAFVPTPEITPYQFYQCRKLLDGLIKTSSRLGWIMDNDLLMFWQETTDTDTVSMNPNFFAKWMKGLETWVCSRQAIKG